MSFIFRRGFVTRESVKAMGEVITFMTVALTFWVHLFAEMQSGKTDTYLLVACELFRLGLIEHVIIMCGSSDTILKKELTKKINYFIYTTYNHYLEDELKMSRDDRDDLIAKLKEKVELIWGTSLKNNILNPEKTLIILEESHFAQSKNMMPDKFLKGAGICANGDYETLRQKNCYVLSVSATGFSEISDIKLNHTDAFNKGLVRLESGRNYYGIRQMHSRGKIKGFRNHLHALEQACSQNYGKIGYGLVRIKKDKDKEAERIAIMHGYKVKYFDSEKREDGTFVTTLDELENEPDEPTIIFIKDKCRMGKEVPKQHIVFCMETAKSAKTDTILQGLLGRMCGYFMHDIDVYIHDNILRSGDIETYIRFCEGSSILIPSNAMNLKSVVRKNNTSTTTTTTGGNAIIPLKIDVDTINVPYYSDSREEHDLLRENIRTCLIAGNCIDKNSSEQSREIIEKVNRLPISAFKIHRIEDGHSSYADAPKRLYDSFSTGIPSGPGTSVNVPSHGEEFSLLYFSQAYPEYDIERGCVFIYTTTKSRRPVLNEDEVFRMYPKTNKKEMFCRKPEELLLM